MRAAVSGTETRNTADQDEQTDDERALARHGDAARARAGGTAATITSGYARFVTHA